jgi:hypothetical protein
MTRQCRLVLPVLGILFVAQNTNAQVHEVSVLLPSVDFESAADFCNAVDAVVVAKAGRASTKTSKMLEDTIGRTLVEGKVEQIIRQDLMHPIDSVVPIILTTGTHEVGGHKMRWRTSDATPAPGSRLVLFLKWEDSSQAYYPYGGAGGIFDVNGDGTLKTHTAAKLPKSLNGTNLSSLVADLKQDPLCAR